MSETQGESVAVGSETTPTAVGETPVPTRSSVPATTPAPTAPISLTYKFPITIDRAGIEAVAGHLRSVFGLLEFRASGSDLSTHKGPDLDAVFRKDLYGNGHIRELWITREGSSMGIYFQESPEEPVRVYLPGEAKETANAIEETLKKYRAPYWRLSIQPLWWFVNCFLFLPYYVGATLTGLVHSPGSTLDALGALAGQGSGASPAMVPARPSGAGLVAGILKGAFIFALLVAIVTLLLAPFRGILRIAFPMLAFDVEPNRGRNKSAMSFRYAFLGIPVSAFIAGLFG